ncbi:MAG: VWA domain-containing protein, partial [Sphingobacteriales bacterium]
HQVHNLIILDESGSMQSIKSTIIQGFNEIVQTVKGIQSRFPEQEHFISMLTFNSFGQKLLHFMEPVNKLEQIDEKKYSPNASTPLYDAMGFGFTKLRKALDNQTDCNVLVTILTDGQENDSKEYTGEAIKKLIEELKLNRWTFTYIGADHDVEEFALSISITNHMVFEKNVSYVRNMFSKEMKARESFSQKIRDEEDTSDDFYITAKKTI